MDQILGLIDHLFICYVCSVGTEKSLCLECGEDQESFNMNSEKTGMKRSQIGGKK